MEIYRCFALDFFVPVARNAFHSLVYDEFTTLRRHLHFPRRSGRFISRSPPPSLSGVLHLVRHHGRRQPIVSIGDGLFSLADYFLLRTIFPRGRPLLGASSPDFDAAANSFVPSEWIFKNIFRSSLICQRVKDNF